MADSDYHLSSWSFYLSQSYKYQKPLNILVPPVFIVANLKLCNSRYRTPLVEFVMFIFGSSPPDSRQTGRLI